MQNNLQRGVRECKSPLGVSNRKNPIRNLRYMEDRFIKVVDMFGNDLVFRESSIKSMDQSKEFATITFMDGHKAQVKTCVGNIWTQLSQNQK